ncbi:hypothetical protein QFZ81_005332 [Paenibacillus sp. V4I9]|nr:hypothetical protein [Paenibacillus sp. V4I9]
MYLNKDVVKKSFFAAFDIFIYLVLNHVTTWEIVKLFGAVVVTIRTPELYELEYFFECDAKYVDEGVPWQYTSVASRCGG